MTEQEIADLIYQHTGLSQQQFPDEYADSLKLVKAALAQQPQGEPVYQEQWPDGSGWSDVTKDRYDQMVREGDEKWVRVLYATPPQAAPVYDKSVVKRLATQMGLIPEPAASVAQGLTDEKRRAAAKAMVEVFLGFPAPDREPGELDLRAVDAVAAILAVTEPLQGMQEPSASAQKDAP